uniref:Uncharacterized protein n=1 Tax=Meloidogyne enterolobii TaxID=390850 RepID=A0A6V7UVB5_MELEN|nr:unnamed protein product [Meloidogyne enterolobii]
MYLPLNKFVLNGRTTGKKICSSKYLFLFIFTFIFCLYFFIKIWPNNNYQKFVNKNFINSNLIPTGFGEECSEDKEKSNDKKWSFDCCGEKMAYSIIIETNNKLTQSLVSGRRFDCKHLPLINKYKLADKYKIQQKITVQRPGSNNFTIVTASNAEYFDTLKKLLYLLKNKFGCSQKIIGYDLGGISENKTMMDELELVCLLEWRKFDWNIIKRIFMHPKLMPGKSSL